VRVFDFNSAIVRTPGNSVINGLRANSGPAPDFTRVLSEHASYITALQAAGVQVTVLPALEAFPDSIFVEDPALVFSQGAIILRPGAPSRMAEADELRPVLGGRFREVLQLNSGYADGGDILVTPGRVYIGLSARTDNVGAVVLRELLASIGLASQVVDTPRDTLHLKSDCSLLDEDTVLATRELANSGILDGFRTLIASPEERAATNALRVNDVVFVRSDCPRTQELLVKNGFSIVTLPVAEIAKIDAGLSCMSLRWFDQAVATRERARHSASMA
jgi:dimethylargininase